MNNVYNMTDRVGNYLKTLLNIKPVANVPQIELGNGISRVDKSSQSRQVTVPQTVVVTRRFELLNHPDEMLSHIFQFLSIADLNSLRDTCKRFKTIAERILGNINVDRAISLSKINFIDKLFSFGRCKSISELRHRWQWIEGYNKSVTNFKEKPFHPDLAHQLEEIDSQGVVSKVNEIQRDAKGPKCFLKNVSLLTGIVGSTTVVSMYVNIYSLILLAKALDFDVKNKVLASTEGKILILTWLLLMSSTLILTFTLLSKAPNRLFPDGFHEMVNEVFSMVKYLLKLVMFFSLFLIISAKED